MIMGKNSKENTSEKERKSWRITSIIRKKKVFKKRIRKEKKEKCDNLDYNKKEPLRKNKKN